MLNALAVVVKRSALTGQRGKQVIVSVSTMCLSTSDISRVGYVCACSPELEGMSVAGLGVATAGLYYYVCASLILQNEPWTAAVTGPQT